MKKKPSKGNMGFGGAGKNTGVNVPNHSNTTKPGQKHATPKNGITTKDGQKGNY